MVTIKILRQGEVFSMLYIIEYGISSVDFSNAIGAKSTSHKLNTDNKIMLMYYSKENNYSYADELVKTESFYFEFNFAPSQIYLS